MANELDTLFEQYARKAEEEKSNKKPTFTRDLEKIKYTGLEQGTPKIVRIVGEPFDSGLSDTTGRTVTIARVIGDDGKKFRLIRPSFQEDPNYIINRIIAKVKQARWVDKQKVVPVQQNYPEIYNIIDKNGLQATDPKAKFDKGWAGKEVLILNVIDREQMDWHKENKHTMLLAKSVNEDSEGNEWVDEGISAYAASEQIIRLWKRYGSWENYDVSITRTGSKDQAYIIENATRTPEVVDDEKKEKLISQLDHLTDEEKSWERYDISKLFRKTTNTKIYNKLKGTIARIDAALGTHFLSELEVEVEKEKKLFEELYGTEGKEVTEVEVAPGVVIPLQEETNFESNTTTETVAPMARARKTATESISEPVDNNAWVKLPYAATALKFNSGGTDYDFRKYITNVTNKDGIYTIDWDTSSENINLAYCPDCGAVAPEECPQCPACGTNFL